MQWFIFIVILSVISTGLSINRPVYKIVLKQKGYAQFLQYDLETPPLREFTICTWIRVYEWNGDQSIFTYVANGNNRVVRLWLNTGGKRINVSINGKVTSTTAVDITKDVWRHICLSYQADYGAWALYVDSRIVSCQASQSLQGFVLPGSGSVIIGYGTAEEGSQNGLEGEIFGTNMILTSTIERNYTIRNDPFYRQKPIRKNKMKSTSSHTKYIILNDLQTGELKNNFETTQLPIIKTTKSFIKVKTPHSFIEHIVGSEFSTKKPLLGVPDQLNKNFMRLPVPDKQEQPDGLSFWNLSSVEHTGKYNVPDKKRLNIGPSSLSEFETPPPPPKHTSFEKTLEIEKASSVIPHKFKAVTEPAKTSFKQKITAELAEVETPPPVEKNAKVYGQWTSSKYAGSVLNYLKSIKFHSREQRKIPQTIPLNKISDSFPYASDFKLTKVRPPLQFRRRNLVEKQFETSKRIPQINLQILEDDFRNNIIKTHAQIQPINVDIINRGNSLKKQHHRVYRKVDSKESTESLETIQGGAPFFKSKPKNTADLTLQTNNLLSILPFLKSLEYFVENSQDDNTVKDKSKNNMYTKSLGGNKWHNVKSYSNDYTPREFKLDPGNEQSAIEQTLSQMNIRQPGIRLNYKHENRNHKLPLTEESLVSSRALAMEVSNQSDHNKDSVSILKYNHGFLPGHNNKIKGAELHGTTKGKSQNYLKNSFDKQIKIGNALNERHVIGVSKDQNKESFVGGDESIPEINKYTSNLHNTESTQESLELRVCTRGNLDPVLYIQHDESIDMTRIMSPIRRKNVGIEFILQNYKMCSLEESVLQDNPMLFIDWSRTPVRLFGGSYPKTTTDLCGFFK